MRAGNKLFLRVQRDGLSHKNDVSSPPTRFSSTCTCSDLPLVTGDRVSHLHQRDTGTVTAFLLLQVVFCSP